MIYCHENKYLNFLRDRICRLMSDETRIRMTWWKKYGERLDLGNPVTFNEKLQWLKLRYRNELQAQCADKFAVREFVRERVGEEILNELIGVYDNVDEINMDQLPDSFVLKATHGSMMNIICKDKRALDWPAAQEKMRRWMRCNYYWVERERWYRGIRPRIICEKYLEDPVTRDLRDYKMLCFDGEVKYIWVDIDRFTLHRRNFYDTNWKYKAVGMTFPNAPDVQIERPERLSRLIEVASLLSRGFPHVRVDLYYLENKNIIFGEMTFCAGGGWEPFSSRAFAEELGGYIKLPIQTGR